MVQPSFLGIPYICIIQEAPLSLLIDLPVETMQADKMLPPGNTGYPFKDKDRGRS